MARPRSSYLLADYKLSLPAPLVAEIDMLLQDPLSQRPIYGARSRLTEALYRAWLAHLRGQDPLPFPTLAELRNVPNA